MDTSAIIVVVVLSALFFGFIVWLNVLSRRDNAERIPPEMPETRMKKEIKN